MECRPISLIKACGHHNDNFLKLAYLHEPLLTHINLSFVGRLLMTVHSTCRY